MAGGRGGACRMTAHLYDLDSVDGLAEYVGMASTDFLDTAAVAELAGVNVETVRMHLYRRTMPEPDYRLGASPVWKRATIEKWLRERPGPGRPSMRGSK